MKSSSWRKYLMGDTIQSDFEEIRDLTIKYVKEETVQPVKDMGRFVQYGVIGSLLVGFGYALLLLAALRYLQWQFPTLNGNLSWIPYLVVVILALVIILVTAWRIVSGPAKRRLKETK